MKIGGLVENKHLTMFRITSIQDKPGTAAEILKIFAEENIKLQYITESSIPGDTAVMSICVDKEQAKQIDRILLQNEQYVQNVKITKLDDVSIVGIYGPHFREKPILAAKFCKVLGEADINILGISSSISSISTIIKSEELPLAKMALLDVFELP